MVLSVFLRKNRLSKFFSRKTTPGRTAIYTILILMVVVIALPLVFLLWYSLKPIGDTVTYPVDYFPKHLHWINYLYIIEYPPFSSALVRTSLLSGTTAVITCLTSAMVGYGFARMPTPGNRLLFRIVISTLLVPSIVLQIPQFIIYAQLRLVNTYWPWYLVALGANPLYIFMYHQFFKSFPTELEEAAEIDGCTPFKTFIRVILPNSKPIMATVLIFAFNAVWGDYIMPFLFLNDPEKLLSTWLAPVLAPQYAPIIFASSVVYTMPAVILYFLVQKHIQKSWLFTGLRG